MAKASATVRMAVDYGVPVAFLLTWLVTKNAQTATWVLVATSAVALLVGWFVERRLAPLPLFAGASALVFGTLSLISHDPNLIKIKFTFVEGVLAAFMFCG